MAWECCGWTGLPDTGECPACGAEGPKRSAEQARRTASLAGNPEVRAVDADQRFVETFGAPPAADDPSWLASHPGAAEVDDGDDDDFWNAHKGLAMIRGWARARRAGPYSVLAEILAQTMTRIPPQVVLPPFGEWSADDETIVGTASLNTITALVGPSGFSKGMSHLIGSQVVRWPDYMDTPAYSPLGSGEGVAATYVACKRNQSDQSFEMIRLASSALFTATEIDKLAALTGRKNTTLSAVLRMLWSGEALGEGNASETTRRYVARGTYRAAVIVHVQPDRGHALLNGDETAGGTPQRILWLPSQDWRIPDKAPAPPAPMAWKPAPEIRAAAAELEARGLDDLGNVRPVILPVCRLALDAIDRAAVARHRGEADAIDGHALTVREKVAAALGFWLGRFGITDEDWELAGLLMAKSDRTRQGIVNRMHEALDRENTARGIAEANRAQIVEQRVEAEKMKATGVRIAKVLSGHGEAMSHSNLRRECGSRYRLFFDEALESLILNGTVIRQIVEYHGSTGYAYRIEG